MTSMTETFAGEETVAGYRTAKVASNVITAWYALDYGCALVKDRWGFETGEVSEKELVALTGGEPNPALFEVPANAKFVVIVNAIDTGMGGAYTLDVHGSDCAPQLNITQVATNKIAVDWTTASAGFLLESTNNLAVPALPIWASVTNVPVANNGRFTVTNDIGNTNQFFRLRKPVP